MSKVVQAAFDDLLTQEGMPPELPSVFTEFDQFPEDKSSELERAGVDAGTDSCTFLEMNGRNIFVTGDTNGETEEGVMASPR